MNKIKNKYICRACGVNSKLIDLTFNLPRKLKPLFPYSYRGLNSKSLFCEKCGSISFYSTKKINYKSGEYRKIGKAKSLPIDLPWSTITYKRHISVFNLIKNYLPKKINSNFKLLDFGGYNGFCSYGICQNLGIKLENGFVADLDKNGLAVASSLGLSTYNLGEKSLSKYLKNSKQKFSLVTAIHVLEHLEDPSTFFIDLRKYLSKEAIIYVEVPSKFFFPLSDPSHITTFSKEGLKRLGEENGFKMIMNCTNSAPKESIFYGYPLRSKFENESYIFKLEETSFNHLNKKEKSYSARNYIIYSLLADLFLRFVVIKNYFNTSIIFIKSVIKSILIFSFSTLIISTKIILNLIFLRFKK